jgi:hypothetical protein
MNKFKLVSKFISSPKIASTIKKITSLILQQNNYNDYKNYLQKYLLN